MSEKTYRIKPLVWDETLKHSIEEYSSLVDRHAYSVLRTRYHDKPWNEWMLKVQIGSNYPSLRPCHTAAEGKALAEAHWRKTIAQFLEEVRHD